MSLGRFCVTNDNRGKVKLTTCQDGGLRSLPATKVSQA